MSEGLNQAIAADTLNLLAWGIVHDFNNHLTGIICCLKLMETEVGRENLSGVETYIHAAHGAAQRATILSRRLLDFSSQRAEVATPTDIDSLIQGMEILIRLAVPPTIKLEFDCGRAAGEVLVDPPQLENAVLNLCINARDAMPDGGVLRISTRNESLDRQEGGKIDGHDGDFICLSVSDTGSGICPEDMPRIFDPLFTTKPAGKGTGLGLSIIQKFVGDMGGHLKVVSQQGEGATFQLYLPLHRQDRTASPRQC